MGRLLKIFLLLLAGLLSAFVVIAALSYVGPDSRIAAGVLTKLNLPIGLSSGKVVLAKDVSNTAQSRANLGKLLQTWQESNVEKSLLKQVGLDKSFCDEVAMDVATCLKYGWIKSESLNKSGYSKSRQVLQRLSMTDFSEVAKVESDDEATKIFGGDAGLVRLDSVLPEFALQLREIKEGETSVVSTRHGLHVVKLKAVYNHAEDKTQVYEFSEIFLKPDSSFESWLETSRKAEKLVSFVD